jgi:hypothetical protein
MADWYVSSATYASVPVWQASHAYSIGDLIKPTVPAAGKEYVFRVTTAGTSGTTEPTWPVANNATVTGGAVFTNVSGQSTYGWSAAAGTLLCIGVNQSNRPAVGDRVFVSSDHSETQSLTYPGGGYGFGTAGFGLIQIVSVNRGGSVPPVAGDVLPGASITTSGAVSIALDPLCNMFWQGFIFTVAGTGGSFQCNGNSSFTKTLYLKDCSIKITNTSTSSRIQQGAATTKLILDNTPVQFGNASQGFNTSLGTWELEWINTPSAVIGAILPSTLFMALNSTGYGMLTTCRGVDLSAITGTLVAAYGNTTGRALFDSCRIAGAAVRYATPGTGNNTGDIVELVNCYDGTNVLNERHTSAGDITTDRSTTLTGGAQDDIGAYSLKLVSSARSDKSVLTLDCFAFDVENTAIGVAKTATVEIVSSLSLNNDDISLLLEYMGTAGNPVASFVSSLPTNVLTTPAVLTSSSNTWAGPATTTWNPGDLPTNTTPMTLSGGNLIATAGGNNSSARGVIGLGSNKYYIEYTVATFSNCLVGFALLSAVAGNSANAVLVNGAGQIVVNGTAVPVISVGSITTNAVGVAIDLSARLIWFRNGALGSWNATSGSTNNPSTGVGGVDFSSLPGVFFPFFMVTSATGQAATANFGASAFAGVVPSGFTAGWPGVPGSKQLLQVPFTPQRTGRVRGLVRLGKPSTTCWVNPQILTT